MCNSLYFSMGFKENGVKIIGPLALLAKYYVINSRKMRSARHATRTGKSEIMARLGWRNLRERGHLECGWDNNIKMDRQEIKLETGME
jgi:hypothetical protein